jgi:hypothetical protein
VAAIVAAYQIRYDGKIWAARVTIALNMQTDPARCGTSRLMVIGDSHISERIAKGVV